MPTERIQIIVSSKGAVTVRKDLEGIGTSATRANRGVDMLRSALGIFATGAVLTGLARYSDTFTNLQNNLRLVTSGTEDLSNKTQDLFDIAQNTRTSFDAVATLYSRTQRAVRDYGISAQETMNFVDLLSKATVVSGASAIEATNAIRQLTQGLASGELRGEEFRSVAEQLPYVLDVLSESLGKTRGELRDMAYDGQLTPELIIKAFSGMGDTINAEFGRTVPTIGQALQVLNNSFTMLVGNLNGTVNAFNLFAYAIIWVANNLNLIMVALTPVMAALTILGTQVLAQTVIGALTGTVAAFGRLGVFLTSTVLPIVVQVSSALVGMAATIATTLVPSIARLTAVMLTNPLFLGGTVALVAGIVYFREELMRLAGTITDTVAQLADLERFGDFLDGEFKISVTGQAFAAEADNAIRTAGSAAAAAMKSGIQSGGASVASQIASAGASAAAQYEALNGRAVKEVGKTLVEGGEYWKNEVTGEITKAGQKVGEAGAQASKDMNAGIKDGGDYAADKFQQAGQKVGNTIFQTLESAYATLAPLADVFKLFERKLNAEVMAMKTEANAALIEARAAEKEARTNALNNDTGRRSNFGGGGGYGSTGSGYGHAGYVIDAGKRTGDSFVDDKLNQLYGRPAEEKEPTTVTVTNIIDPGMATEAMNTGVGGDVILNQIKGNRAEIQRILGVR